MSIASDRQSEVVFSDRENMAAGGALLWQNNNPCSGLGGYFPPLEVITALSFDGTRHCS